MAFISQKFIANGGTTYTLNRIVSSPDDIFVIVNGLVLVPINDYSISSTNLIFVSAPPTGSDIEVRYFDSSTIGASGFQGSSGFRGSIGFTGSRGLTGTDGLNGFIGSRGFTGSRGTGFTGSSGFNGSTGAVGAPNYSQIFTSTGIASYTLDLPVINPNHIIVSVNGLIQIPTTDYQILSGTTLFFNTIPPTGSDIEIRFFTIANIVGFRGSVGFQGSVGVRGSVGFQGSSGEIGPTIIYISDVEDPAPYDGQLWFDTDNGILSIYYEPENTWVGIGPGLRGAIGYTGSGGSPNGYTGSRGFTGSKGETGEPGPTGATGATGPSGTNGVRGYTGSKGADAQVVEDFDDLGNRSGLVNLDVSSTNVFRLSPTGPFSINFGNVNTIPNNKTTTFVVFLVQDDPAIFPTTITFGGVEETILWQGATLPVGNASKTDAISFTILKTSSGLTVFGQLISFGTV